MIRQARDIPTSTGRTPARRAAAGHRAGRARLTIFTVGHSTRSAKEFLDLLRAHGIEQVVDVRRFPGSRRLPHFGRDALARFLRNHRIGYRHIEALGGRRQPQVDSPNGGWRNAAFRGYADYMQTEAFDEALDRLVVAAGRRRTAILCAEALPWRCHRRLLSDALVARDIRVAHIISPSPPRPHTITPMAVRSGHRLAYPAPVE